MKLSIITICYNDKAGLVKTAESVCKQTYREFEWIIIDGGSKDGCKEIIENLASNTENNITYWCSEPDKGIYNAMNKGITKAKGEYLLFLNSGDYLCSTKSLKRATNKSWECDIVAFDEFLDEGGKYMKLNRSPRKVTYHRFLRGCLFHQCTLIKRELLKEGYSENYKLISDLVFWVDKLIVGNATYQNYAIPITVFDGNGRGSVSSESHMRELMAYKSKYINEDVLKTVIDTSTLVNAIEAMYLPNFLKGILLFSYRVVYSFYVRLYASLEGFMMQLRYID